MGYTVLSSWSRYFSRYQLVTRNLESVCVASCQQFFLVFFADKRVTAGTINRRSVDQTQQPSTIACWSRAYTSLPHCSCVARAREKFVLRPRLAVHTTFKAPCACDWVDFREVKRWHDYTVSRTGADIAACICHRKQQQTVTAFILVHIFGSRWLSTNCWEPGCVI